MRTKLKHKLNIIIDTVAFIEFVFISTTGLLVKYTLPAGSGHYATIWGLDRHEWGNLHFWVCIAFLATLMIHLILHWKWIFFRLRGKKSDDSGIRFGMGIFGFVMLIIVGLIPMFSSVEYESRPGRERRLLQIEQEQQTVKKDKSTEAEQHLEDESQPTEDSVQTNERETEYQGHETDQTQQKLPHEVSGAEVDVRGYMTVKEISDEFEVPVDHILKELGLPENTDEKETFGRLRRRYDIEMHDVRQIILDYKER
ncbi:MAG: DUF4405 domain-containing protein [Bacteroidales bacterium]|nr:DUF4405 domain-containing protein [Bacteroidales bacterium]